MDNSVNGADLPISTEQEILTSISYEIRNDIKAKLSRYNIPLLQDLPILKVAFTSDIFNQQLLRHFGDPDYFYIQERGQNIRGYRIPLESNEHYMSYRESAYSFYEQEFKNLKNVNKPESEEIFELLKGKIRYCTDQQRITAISIDGLPISQIPKSIFLLTDLKVLSVTRCFYVREIPNEIYSLQNLLTLNLSANGLESVPDAIGYLQKLQILLLKYNRIQYLPTSTGKLANLNTLDISYNRIEKLPNSLGSLNALWVHHDFYKQFRLSRSGRNEQNVSQPQYQAFINGKCGIDVSKNPLISPPMHMVDMGIATLKEYWQSILDGEGQLLNELKIILVGEGGSGKTSIAKLLNHEEFDLNEPKTHGINIRQFEIANKAHKIVHTRIWDFGGQQIMHSTHQFFLSKRSLYIIVTDSRKDERVEYWLKHVEVFGGKCPVLILINKIDENPGFDVNRRFLREKYPNIAGFIRMSCVEKVGLDELKGKIVSTFDKIDHLTMIWPDSWFRAKRSIERIAHHFISSDDYREICYQENLTEDQQVVLIEFLNDLGIVLYFKDLHLKDVKVINPHWITDAIYTIINSKILASQCGKINVNNISDILNRHLFPISKHSFFISLMKKFELCYELNNDYILVPDLLPVEQPEFSIPSGQLLKTIFLFPFLPKSIIARLIVRLHRDVKETYMWRTGIILENPSKSSIAIIKSDDEEKKIEIEVYGVNKRDYYAVIRHELLNINASFDNLIWEERIVMDDRSTYNFDHLLFLEMQNIDTFIPEGSRTAYSVKKVLGSVSAESYATQNILVLLEELVATFKDDRDTILNEANRIIDLKPNFAGIGINLNALLDKLLKGKGKKKRTNSSRE